MSKLIMWNLITLNGYFEGEKPWSLDWHESVWGDELEQLSLQQLHETDCLLFGRRTYEGMASYWQTAQGEIAELMNGLPKAVCSRTLERADWANTSLIRDDVPAAIAALKKKGGKNIFVFGSANLSATLMQAGLFDEYRIAVAPTVLERGHSLFGEGMPRMQLKLLEARPLTSGCVVMRYEPALVPQ